MATKKLTSPIIRALEGVKKSNLGEEIDTMTHFAMDLVIWGMARFVHDRDKSCLLTITMDFGDETEPVTLSRVNENWEVGCTISYNVIKNVLDDTVLTDFTTDIQDEGFDVCFDDDLVISFDLIPV